MPAPEPSLIIYDGDCVFCQNYVRFVRLQEAIGPVELLDARSADPRVNAYKRLGYDLDEGMLLVYRGQVHHGADAVHMLAGLSGRSNLFSRVNRAVLSSRRAAVLLYPALKLGRRLTLLARGKKPISPLEELAES